MKKLSLLLIVLCSYSSFAQFENYTISKVELISNADIYESVNAITVPEGKVWKIVVGYGLRIINNNNVLTLTTNRIGHEYSAVPDDVKNIIVPSGYKIYAKFTDGYINYIEYDLSQQLSHAEPKIDNRPTLFPNPTNSMLSLNSDKNYKIQVFDLNGRKLMEQNGNTLNMEHLSNATYVVKAMDIDTKEMLSYKVVKE